MRGYQNPFLHRSNVTDQRGIALRVTVGRPPTLTKRKKKTVGLQKCEYLVLYFGISLVLQLVEEGWLTEELLIFLLLVNLFLSPFYAN